MFFSVTRLSVEPDDVTVEASTLVNLHVRALIEKQPTQILAGEPHDMKPWFAGQIDYVTYHGYEVAVGRHGDFEFQIVSDLNRAELSALLKLLSTDG